jgi:hypothetical protein
MTGDGFGYETPPKGEGEPITPSWLIDALGGPEVFNLDPCISQQQPWVTAKKAYSVEQDGLTRPWWGAVWLNPPSDSREWFKRLADHGHGIGLVPIEAPYWHDVIFPTASGFLFPYAKIELVRPDGAKPEDGGDPLLVLVAWGSKCRARLISAVESGRVPGAFLDMAFYTGSGDGTQHNKEAGMDEAKTVTRAIDVDANLEALYIGESLALEAETLDLDSVLEKLVGTRVGAYDVCDADTSETEGKFPLRLEDLVEVGEWPPE